MKAKILIIGSTGKLGSKLLKYAFSNNIKIFAATCFNNKKKLLSQKLKYKIDNTFILSDQKERDTFLKFLTSKISLIYFLDFGSSSLIYLNQFLNYNNNSIIAIANKEMIIAGGKILFNKFKSTNTKFIPLDSEHFSLKNSLQNNNIKKIYITASGGPFFFKKKLSIENVSLSQVKAHPKWKMGLNNLIDSSNFINKLLEIFELSYIYDIPLSKIDFLVSKEAFIHSVIEYHDGICSLNTFKNDMLITLSYPLNKLLKNQNHISSKNYLFNTKNFQLDLKYDKRFILFKYYKMALKFNHQEQINFMLLNNIAQNQYLSGNLRYSNLIPHSINRLKKMKKNHEFKSLIDIVNYINNFIQNES